MGESLLNVFLTGETKMFICVGQNDSCSKSYGLGGTIEMAIKDWAEGTNYIQEYTEYTPGIYEAGDSLNIDMRIEFVIK